MKNPTLLSRTFLLASVLILSSCSKVDTDKFKPIPVVVGDTPATSANALVGTWETSDFTIRSTGSISGQLKINLSRPVRITNYQDVLIIQVWANYIWPQTGDIRSTQAGEFIPIKSIQATDTSATFDIQGKFDLPPLKLDTDGGMPLHHFQIDLVWTRIFSISDKGGSYFQAKLGTPENIGDLPWKGVPIFDQTVALHGKIDTNVRGGLNYTQWFRENFHFPTSTPGTYPEPLGSPTMKPVQPYPPAP